MAERYQAVLHDISPMRCASPTRARSISTSSGCCAWCFRAPSSSTRRHPVDNCLSIYMSYFAAADMNFMGSREELVFYYREYTRLMQHWRQVLPPERFLELDYEALVADPEAETRRLIAFCELEWNDACLRPERNRRAVSTASLVAGPSAGVPHVRSSGGETIRPWLSPPACCPPRSKAASPSEAGNFRLPVVLRLKIPRSSDLDVGSCSNCDVQDRYCRLEFAPAARYGGRRSGVGRVHPSGRPNARQPGNN